VTDQDFCAYEDPSESLMFGGSRNWSGAEGSTPRFGQGSKGTSLDVCAQIERDGSWQSPQAPSEPKLARAGIKPGLQFLEQPNASSRGHVCNPAGCEGVQPSSDEQTAEWKEGLPHPSTGCDSTEGDR
jgi:hypothetical protein